MPFAREYGGLLDNRSFGGAQVSRTFYARGQTGQQLLLGAYQSMMRQVERGTVKSFANREMLDLVLVNGQARGIVVRNLSTGAIERYAGHAVLLCTGGYGTAYYLSTNAVNSNVTAAWRAHKRGAFFANPCYTQIHPTCIPVSGTHQSKLTLMSESLRNDGRVWVPKQAATTSGRPSRFPRRSATTTSSAAIRASATWCRATSRRATPRRSATKAAASARAAWRSIWTSADAIKRLGADVIRARYGNLFDMYTKITDEDPYDVPMRIYPAIHYTMGGLWVDYNLMSTIPGLHVLGEANFSDHGANRLGASALMQGLADGYFVIPNTLGALPRAARPSPPSRPSTTRSRRPRAACRRGSIGCCRSRAPRRRDSSTASSARSCGTTSAWRGTKRACAARSNGFPQLREEFWQNVSVPGPTNNLNKNLEYAGRVADYLEFAEAAGARRAAPHRIVRRPLPRGEPDARRRGAARRRALLATSRPGSSRASASRRRCTRSRWCSST